MPLTAGARVGPYEILAPLGAGGMGEVYRARDTRLDRIVAVKVLPAEAADRADLRERFEREARAVSNLNHPHICALYDIGHQDGVDFIVMEHLEGETLWARLERGPLPPEEVLRLGIQIADALDAAHRQGFIHRDLKPGNVMLTRSGAKLLDFGLAKSFAAASPASVIGLTAAPTATSPLTAEGAIVGTFHYMAPEQIEGGALDARTDIFALGVVLYEMATGRRPFAGKTQASLMASILKEDPRPISALVALAPPALDRVVKTCLAKEPADRWQSAHDLALQIRWIAEAGSQAGVPAPVAARRRSRERVAWGAAAILAAACLGLGLALWRSASVEVRAIRTHVLPPEGTSFVSVDQSAGPVEVSPDGHRLAFVAGAADGRRQLFVRDLLELEARPLAGTDGAARPFWSPDGRHLGFFADGKLKRIESSGGPALALCAAPDARGGTWNREGVIIFSPEADLGLWRVPASGGKAVPLTGLDKSLNEETHRYPRFLPDGRRFIYLARTRARTSAGPDTAIYAGSLDLYARQLLVRGSSDAQYASGHLLYVRDFTLMAHPFDPERLAFTGDAFPIAQDVRTDLRFSRAVFSVSEAGVLAYQTGKAQSESQVVLFGRDGHAAGAVGAPATQSRISLSPDGSKAAVDLRTGDGTASDVWIHDLARGIQTRFTFDTTDEVAPRWSPDGRQIVYSSQRKGHYDLYLKASGGMEGEELLVQSDQDKFASDWSDDGRYVLYIAIDSKTRGDVWAVPVAGDRKPVPLLRSKFFEGTASFSPDGRWLAYDSDESGREEIYVAPFPAMDGKWQISANGGAYPVWRSGGREIFYLDRDRNLAVAEVRLSASGFAVGQVRHLLKMNLSRDPGLQYDVSRDGQTIIANTVPETDPTSPIVLVQNWTADLKK